MSVVFPAVRCGDLFLPESKMTVSKGIKGWIKAHIFHSAIAFLDRENKKVYLDKKSLVKALVPVEDKKKLSTFFKNRRIRNLTLQLLNPIRGKINTLAETVEKIKRIRTEKFCRKLQSDGGDLAKLQSRVIKKLEKSIDSRLTNFSYDPKELPNHLQAGDLLFYRFHPDVPSAIVNIQKIFYPFMKGPVEREAFRYSHAAIYLGVNPQTGEGEVAEAAWPNTKKEEIRILPLKDSRFAIPDAKGQYLVSSPKDRELGQRAAEVASHLAARVSEENSPEGKKTPLRYSKIGAARSLWHSSSFGLFGKYRYVKQYQDYKEYEESHFARDNLPKDFLHPTRLFCSYFVGVAYQIAEGERFLPSLLKGARPAKTKWPFLNALLYEGWVRYERWKHLRKLDNNVAMRFDAKFVNPQDLRRFVINNPDQFEDALIIKRGS